MKHILVIMMLSSLGIAMDVPLDGIYKAALMSFAGYELSEYSYTINGSGKAGPITSSHAASRNRVTVLSTDLAIVHSHPKHIEPSPSCHDVDVAVRLHIPNYVISERELWVAWPSGKIEHLGHISFNH